MIVANDLYIWYRGYCTSISFDYDIGKFTGKIEEIDDLVYFESEYPHTIIDEFHLAVDQYIEILNR